MSYPLYRSRRLRQSNAIRRLVRETRLDPADFIYPIFVSENIDRPIAIDSMPGINRYPLIDAIE